MKFNGGRSHMIRMLILSFVLSTGFSVSAQEIPSATYWESNSQAPQFCVQNFNAYGPIYAFNITERTQWMTAELQARPRCAVVQLQEVWNTSQIDQVENALRPFYQVSDPNRVEKIGVMSLFTSEIKSTETHDFKVNSDGNLLDRARSLFNVKKAFHIVRTSLPGVDEDFYFMNTHLHPTSAPVRLTQIVDLLEWRLQHQDLKMLLSGDFNGDQFSMERAVIMSLLGVHDSMLEALGGTYPQGLCTYCARNPLSWLPDDHILDYIFFSNVGRASTRLRAVDGTVNLTGTPLRPLSDHYGLKVDFVVNTEVPAGPSLSDLSERERRRDYAAKLLKQIDSIFAGEKTAEFKVYRGKVQALQEQLSRQQGPFSDYLEKYN